MFQGASEGWEKKLIAEIAWFKSTASNPSNPFQEPSFPFQETSKMNPSTMIMYRYTIYQYDDMCSDTHETMDAEGVQQFWLNMMYDFNEEYDADWFPLVALWEQGRATIDWNAIVRKYKERSAIRFRE